MWSTWQEGMLSMYVVHTVHSSLWSLQTAFYKIDLLPFSLLCASRTVKNAHNPNWLCFGLFYKRFMDDLDLRAGWPDWAIFAHWKVIIEWPFYSFFIIRRNFWANFFSPKKLLCFIWPNILLGYILGDFFQKPSGHRVCDWVYWLDSNTETSGNWRIQSW
jgi:hypothetical protein